MVSNSSFNTGTEPDRRCLGPGLPGILLRLTHPCSRFESEEHPAEIVAIQAEREVELLAYVSSPDNRCVADRVEKPLVESHAYDSFVKDNLIRNRVLSQPTTLVKMPIEDKDEGTAPSTSRVEELKRVGTIEYKNPVELLDSEDKAGCLFYFKYIVVAIRYYVSHTCLLVVQHPVFESVTLLIIFANCVTLAMDDPTTDSQEAWQVIAGYLFQTLYTAELVLKVLALGFAFNVGAYLRDMWNVLDFVIVVVGFLEYFQNGSSSSGYNIKALRVFRVLRPLRTVTSIDGLRVLVSALGGSLVPLLDSLVILIFFLSIFAIAGLQLWHGLLTRRCMNVSTGDVMTNLVCGSIDCPEGYKCVNYGYNPNYGVTSFDNFYLSLLTVFITVTLEGWTDVQISMIRAFGYTTPAFFSLLTLIGAYFLFNFTLAVIKSRVSETYEENKKRKLERRAQANKMVVPVDMGKFRKSVFGYIAVGRARKGVTQKSSSDVSKLSILSTAQTPPIEALRQLMGINEFTEDCNSPIAGEPAKIAAENETSEKPAEPLFTRVEVPVRLASNFRNALKPRIELIHRSREGSREIPELDDFTDRFFGESAERRGADAAATFSEMIALPTVMGDSQSAIPLVSPLDAESHIAHSEHSSNAGTNSADSGGDMPENEPSSEHHSSGESDKVPPEQPEDHAPVEEKKTMSAAEFFKRRTHVAGVIPATAEAGIQGEVLKLPENVPPNADNSEDADEEAVAAQKYVLKDCEFVLTSETEVLPIRLGSSPAATSPSRMLTLPHKWRVKYTPTELPPPEEDKGIEPESKTVQQPREQDAESVCPELAAELARSEAGSASGRGSVVSTPLKRARTVKRKSFAVNRAKRASVMTPGSTPRFGGDSQRRSLFCGRPSISRFGMTNDCLSEFGSTPASQNPELSQTAISGNGNNNEISPSRAANPDSSGEEEKTKPAVEPVPVLVEQLRSDTSARLEFMWSGQEIMRSLDPYAAVWVTDKLSEVRIWKRGMKGLMSRIRHTLRLIMMSEITGGVLMLCVLANTTLLAMNRYGQPDYEANVVQKLNTVFTSIFIVECGLKLVGMGVVKYLSDALNYVDGLVVIFSVIEMIFLDSSNNSSFFRAFQALRILRTLRVVRMIRLIRVLRSMKLLIRVIGETMASFAYVGMLLLVFLFIYSLLGMQLFGGKFSFPQEGKPRQNFDSFHHAFLSVYQVLTVENWQSLLYTSMRAQVPALVALFYVSWLFIGNYILLNLFLALMLDAFADVEEGEEGKDDDDAVFVCFVELGIDNLWRVTRLPFLRQHPQRDQPTARQLPLRQNPLEIQVYFPSRTADIVAVEEQKEDDFTDVMRKKTQKKKIPLSDTQCNYSLYLFSKQNPVRIVFWRIVSSSRFEWGILAAIGFSSILLAIDTFYLGNPDASVTDVTAVFTDIFIGLFALEAVMKALAYGFVFDTGSYLRDFWNVMDFCIVVASLVDLSMTQIDIPMIRILRLLRTFRPLRFVSRNVHMKVMVRALFKSLGALCNTMILILMVFLMFSIVGVSFFSGKFQYCTVDIYANSNRATCMINGGSWKTYDMNFDNVVNGLIYLFELTTQENWPISVYQAVDCTDVDSGPRFDASWYYAYYYVIFLFVGSMFMLNLFVGVMFHNFTKVQKQETETFGGSVATEQQLNWMEVQRMIVRAEPNYNARTAPSKTSWRAGVHMFITSFFFEVFISVVILLNMLQMMMLYDQQSDAYGLALDVTNYIFTGVFTVEVALKLIGYGVNFWYDAWNLFDFVIVLCSYIDITFTNIADNSIRILSIGPQLLRVLRVFRVTRLMRLVRKYKRLQEIMEIIQLCLPSILNVLALLSLILFIYAILGCYMFYNVTGGDAINSVYNFSNFGLAMMLCLKMATGEDWNLFMFDCARTSADCVAGLGCGNVYAYIYFISFKIIVTFIMLNLFVLVVLQLFEKYFIESENIVSAFKEDLELFEEKWQQARPSHSGFFLNVNKLRKFFLSLPDRFSHEETDPNKLSNDVSRNVFFNELLYCTLRPLYIKSMKTNDFVKKKEREARKRILRAAEREAKRSFYSTSRANPFVPLMRMRMTLKMWLHYKNNHMRRVEERQRMGEMNYDSSFERTPAEPATADKLPVVNRNKILPLSAATATQATRLVPPPA